MTFAHLALLSALLFDQSATAGAPEVASVVGHVTLGKACRNAGDDVQLWFSRGSLLLFQTQVQLNGSFEFNTLPGQYNVVATSKNGCFAESIVKAKAGSVAIADLSLGKFETKQKISRAPSSSGAIPNWGCPTCGPRWGWGMPAVAAPMPYYGSPWYVPYGAPSYANFFAPTAMMGWGINGGYFPGGHSAGMGKPNVYVSGKPGTKVTVKMVPKSGTTLWAAVPAHREEGWTGMIKKKGIAVGSTVSPYLYYDYGLDAEELQNEAGFCVSAEELMPRLTAVLARVGFLENEIKDFSEYWSVKMPPSKSFCVYPQENADLNKVAALEVSPAPSSITRIGFLIVPEEGYGKDHAFKSRPEREWAPSHRAPASVSQDGIHVREWGVGFLIQN